MSNVQEMLIKILKRNTFFKDIPDDKLSNFADLFTLWIASKNQAIILEWRFPEEIYIAKSWKFIAKKANWLNSIVLWEIKEWEVFWEMSYFYRKPAVASVICKSDSCSYWKIKIRDFDNFLKANPEIATKITDELAKREKQNKEKLWWNYRAPKKDDDIEINL